MVDRTAHGVEVLIGGKGLSIETGKIAKQADGAVTIRFGDTIVLVAVVMSHDETKQDFLPLTVDYREKTYAAGKIPGGFFKKEGRPTDREVLTSRLIDRSIRPLFPKKLPHEVQLMSIVLSADQENDPDVLALTGAGACLALSGLPFAGPIAGVRVGKIRGEYVANPANSLMSESDMNLVMAGTQDGIVMVEAGAREVSDEDMLKGLDFGHEIIRSILPKMSELVERAGKPRRTVVIPGPSESLIQAVKACGEAAVAKTLTAADKGERSDLMGVAVSEVLSGLDASQWQEQDLHFVPKILEDVQKKLMRQMVLDQGRRIDGRGLDDIRPITCEVGLLPRAHGSGLFTRGETQALAATTLGTMDDEQRLDDLQGETTKSFMLHYYFPPFSVGEVRRLSGQGRREIGHGHLAERALEPMMPQWDRFPYTVRIVSDILESNGSSSMATVCGGTLSLMDAGVPIKAPVAGIAMGLIKEGDRVVILSDILGTEDHLGDMDLKVAGTPRGMTALQMDIKIDKVTPSLMFEAFGKAQQGIKKILDVMLETLPRPRKEPSVHAPRVFVTRIRPDHIGLLIGPGGKNIRKIESLGVTVNVEDDGEVTIYSTNSDAANQAMMSIKDLTQDVQVGDIFEGKVKKITTFGAFVGLTSRQDGLVHISQLAEGRVKQVEDVVKEGDTVKVKVIKVDENGKVSLTMKDVDKEEAGHGEPKDSSSD